MNSIMDTEFEAKFYPVSKGEYREKLKAVGAKLVIPERKMRRVIGDSRANKFIKRSDYVRVRDEGNLVRLSFKTTADEDGKLSDQKETDIEVSDYNKTIQILKMCNVDFNRRQETLREEWEYKDAQITIDTWPGLDTYSEIEAESEDMVRSIAMELGFDWDKRIITAAAEVYAKVYGLDIEDVLKKISNITFENNPFASLTKVWNG